MVQELRLDLKRVLVIGHRGMLGRVVCRVLANAGFVVDVVSERYVDEKAFSFIDAAVHSPAVAVVNCVGTTPHRVSERELVAINGSLPVLLSSQLDPSRLFVHASTDGVFSGAQGPYDVRAVPDANDAYGKSKRMGEFCIAHPRTVVLRTSIVGIEDDREPRGLLGRLLAQNESVNGFKDHLWNGITTLAWARLCLLAIEGKLGPGIHQPAIEPVSKYELLVCATKVWRKKISVVPTFAGKPIDRRLSPTIDLGRLEPMLRELRDFHVAENVHGYSHSS